MVGALRAVIAASAFPAAIALTPFSSSSSSSSRFPVANSHNLFRVPLRSAPAAESYIGASRTPPNAAAFRMDSPATDLTPRFQQDEDLPELLTEFMVDMKCDGCVKAVTNNLLKLEGIKNVDADLSNQVVRVLGTLPAKVMADALEQSGRKARLIGQGNPSDFLVSAAVAEFKGPVIYGVVRLAQVNMELARIEASFSGLSPGKHGWSINEFGDLTNGAASTGKVFNLLDNLKEIYVQALGDLGTLDALDTGEANFTGSKKMLRVADLIGRSIVIYETEDKSVSGIAAAVIARSAGVGENYKKLCTCDGVTIWESS